MSFVKSTARQFVSKLSKPIRMKEAFYDCPTFLFDHLEHEISLFSVIHQVLSDVFILFEWMIKIFF